MTSDDMQVSKGLVCPVVALLGVGHMPAKGEDEQVAARVFYVATTRATQRLAIGVGGDGVVVKHCFDTYELETSTDEAFRKWEIYDNLHQLEINTPLLPDKTLCTQFINI